MLATTSVPRLGPAALVLLAGLACVVAPASAAIARCAGSDVIPTQDSRSGAAADVVCEINQQRVRRDLPKVGRDARLAVAGERYAREMVRRGFFSHVSPDGRGMTERLRLAGYLDDAATWAVGETLAWGSGRRSTPAATVAAWMDSPPHRRVLLDRRYRDVGVGVALGVPVGLVPDPGATYAAELGFAKR